MSDSPSTGAGSATVGTRTVARRRIELDDVAALGDVDDALASFYVEQVTAASQITGVSVREIREWFEDELITPQGFRTQVLTGPGTRGLAVVQELENRHLIRTESKRGALWYEIAHDRLVDPIQSSNAAWRAEHLHPLQIDARAWERQDRAPGLLIGGEALAAAVLWAGANQEQLTDIDQAYLEACRAAEHQLVAIQRAAVRNRRLAIASSSLSILVVLALVATAVFLVRSQRNAREADSQKLIAQENARAAEAAKKDALEQATQAGVARADALAKQADAVAQRAIAVQKAKDAEDSARAAEKSAKEAKDSASAADVAKASAEQEARRATAAQNDADAERAKAEENEAKAKAAAAEAQRQGSLADKNAAEANRNADRALAASLAVRLQPLLDVNPGLAVALAAEATKLSGGESEEVAAAMLKARAAAAARGAQPYGYPVSAGDGNVEAVSISADGRRVASVNEFGVVQVWDTATGTAVGAPRHMPESGAPRRIALSPDARRVVVSAPGQTLAWTVDGSNEPEHSFPSDTHPWTLTFSGDGRFVALDWNKSTEPVPVGIDLFDLTAGTHTVITGRVDPTLSPDGRTMVTRAYPVIEVWDLTVTPPTVITSLPDPAGRPVFSPDGAQFAVVAPIPSADDPNRPAGYGVAVFDARSGSAARPFLPIPGLLSVLYDPDGELLAMVSGDNGTELLDLTAQRPRTRFAPGTAHIAFTPDPSVVVEYRSETVPFTTVPTKYWRLKPPPFFGATAFAEGIGSPILPPPGAGSVVMAANGTWLAYPIGDAVQIVRPPPGAPIARRVPTRVTPTDESTDTSSVVQVFSADGGLLATGTARGEVIVTDVRTKTAVADVSIGSSAVTVLAFTRSRGTTLVVAGDGGGAVTTLDTSTLTTRRTQVTDAPVRSIGVRPDASVMAVGDDDGWIVQVSVPTGATLGPRFGHPLDLPNAVVELVYSPNGSNLASFSGPAGWVWDVSRPGRSPSGPSGGLSSDTVGSLRFSGDGRYFAGATSVVDLLRETPAVEFDSVLGFTPEGRVVATKNGVTRAWNPDGSPYGPSLDDTSGWLAPPPFGQSAVAALDPSGRLLSAIVSTTFPGTHLVVWNVETGHLLGALPISRSVPDTIAFGPDGTTLFTVNGATALVWDELSIDAACAIAAPDVHASQLLPYLDGRQPTACAGVLPA